jgi:ectoine hydroxylase-related dioxygenase (phytanoyl-CoA dioxygenase family)
MPQRLSAAAIDQHTADFLRDGFCLLPGLLDADVLQEWSNAFAPLLENHIREQADPSFRGANRYYVTLPFTQPFADPRIFEHDDVLALVERLAGKDFVMCQLATDTPTLGSDYQDIHADAPPLFPEVEISTPSFQLALNFPLCDVTLENGPLEITRGTHTVDKELAMSKVTAGEIPIEPLKMKLGDAILRDVRGLHRGTPNRTGYPRPMVVIGYSRKWLNRPEVSIQIADNEWNQLSARAKHMLRLNPRVHELPREHRETYKSFAY